MLLQNWTLICDQCPKFYQNDEFLNQIPLTRKAGFCSLKKSRAAWIENDPYIEMLVKKAVRWLYSPYEKCYPVFPACLAGVCRFLDLAHFQLHGDRVCHDSGGFRNRAGNDSFLPEPAAITPPLS